MRSRAFSFKDYFTFKRSLVYFYLFFKFQIKKKFYCQKVLLKYISLSSMTLTISLNEPLWLDIFWKANGTLVILLNGCGAFVIFKFASQEMTVYKYFLMNILVSFTLNLKLTKLKKNY